MGRPPRPRPRAAETACFLAAAVATGATVGFAQRSTGSWVRLTIAAGRDEVLRSNVFVITSLSAINDFWVSGARPVAVVTGAATGALPYAQLLAYAVLWLRPLKGASQSWACAALVQLVRVQHVLTFAAMLLVVALKIDAPLGPLSAEVRVVTGWGCPAFELATLASYGLALWLAAATRRGAPIQALGGAPDALGYAGRASLFEKSGRPRLAWVAAAPAMLVGAALFAPVVRFTMHELARGFVGKKRRTFSVYGVAAAMYGSTARATSKWVWTLWLAIFAVSLDVAAALATAALFFGRWCPDVRRRLATMTVHLHALASADVLAVIVGQIASEIPLISSWIVDAMVPDDLCDDVEKDTRYGGCAVVDGEYRPGMGCLAGYAAAKSLAFAYVNAVVHRASLPACIASRMPALDADAEAEGPLLRVERDAAAV